MEQYAGRWGFGYHRDPVYHVMNPQQTGSGGVTFILFGAATATFRGGMLIVPWWAVVLPLTVAVALAGEAPRRLRERARRRHGRCVACGYDLRGGDACPECGLPAPPQPADKL